MSDFALGNRPTTGRVWGALSQALRETLTNGQAVHIPLNGETYSVVRTRKAGSLSSVARRLNARLRTARDGDDLCIWLESKGEGDGSLPEVP